MFKRTLIAAAAASTLAMAAAAKDPYTRPDHSWITLSGTIESVEPDRFMLDYGDGRVIVEMDSPTGAERGYTLLAGDKVSVSGRIDDDLFERTSIEAASVYVENAGTTFYASPVDDEDPQFLHVVTPVVPARTLVTGTVTDTNGREFTLDTGQRALVVDTSAMGYNPLDDKGFQKIEPGQRVSVSGVMDHDFFEGRELMAKSVVTLSQSSDS